MMGSLQQIPSWQSIQHEGAEGGLHCLRSRVPRRVQDSGSSAQSWAMGDGLWMLDSAPCPDTKGRDRRSCHASIAP